MLAGALLPLFSATSFAAGPTAANTSISNLATVSYNVGAIAQAPIGSSSTGNTSGAGLPTTFLVDDKLLLTVVTNDAADVAVTPGQTGAILVYKVTNNGNATQGVTFTTVHDTGVAGSTAGAGFTGTDNFTPTAISVFVSKNNTATYVPANDTASSIPQLAAGASNFVFIVSNIPAAQVDTDAAVLALVGQEAASGGSVTYGTAPGANITTDDKLNAWTPGAVQNIFADAAGTDDIALDGKHSSRDVYLVKSAKLTITKTSSVVSDPTGDAIPHAIPGAVMKYTITVANTGTTAASSVSLADSINAQVTAGNLAYKPASITIADPNVSAGAPQSCVDAGSTFGSDTCSFTAGTNTVNALINSLTNGQTATVTFQVTIQ
jgi:uncharacterized repeat protein (TIGR01451 family)